MRPLFVGMGAEHRIFPRRSATEGLVDVYRITRLGNRQRLGSCLLIDVSRGGVGLQLDFAVQRGETLFLQNRTFEQYAVVRYCRNLPKGFRVGMKFCAPPAHDKEGARGDSSRRPLRSMV